MLAPDPLVKGLGLRLFSVVTRYVGAQEIAHMLGVSRQRVQQLVTRPDFPAPVERLAMGAFWRRSDVRRWAERTGREIQK